MSERWFFLNGDFSLEKHASIPVSDRGFLFGDGIFTTIRVHQGKCELLKEHLKRLRQQSEELNFNLNPLQFDWIPELIQRNEAWEGTWRLKIIVTAKEEYKMRQIGCVLATLLPYQGSPSDSCTLSLFPHPIESPLAHIKSLSYLHSLHVRDFADRCGHADAIIHTHEGYLLETGCSNLFWMNQDKCWVPDPQLPYLKGVFLQAILPHVPLPIQFIKATIDDLPLTAHVYICNALTHVRPVLSIDHTIFSRSEEREHLLQQATVQALRGNESFVYGYEP